MANKSELTVKQQSFVDLVVAGNNHTKSYTMAGYKGSAETAASEACKLLLNPKISKALSILRNKMAVKTEWKVAKIIQGFEEIFERAMQKVPVMDYDKESKESFQRLEMVEQPDGSIKPEGVWQYDGNVACKALENIAKIVGAYQQMDTGNTFITQYTQHIANIYGTVEAK